MYRCAPVGGEAEARTGCNNPNVAVWLKLHCTEKILTRPTKRRGWRTRKFLQDQSHLALGGVRPYTAKPGLASHCICSLRGNAISFFGRKSAPHYNYGNTPHTKIEQSCHFSEASKDSTSPQKRSAFRAPSGTDSQ